MTKLILIWTLGPLFYLVIGIAQSIVSAAMRAVNNRHQGYVNMGYLLVIPFWPLCDVVWGVMGIVNGLSWFLNLPLLKWLSGRPAACGDLILAAIHRLNPHLGDGWWDGDDTWTRKRVVEENVGRHEHS